MKQILATAFFSISFILLVGVGGYLLIEQGAPKDRQAETSEAIEQPEQVIVPGFSNEMNEAQLQFYLHEMTHSKVYAEDKWGKSRQMSPENIESLLTIVEANKYMEKSFYRNTLEEWREGNFSNAVDVHNTIWNWHNGTIGEATRLMTDEEEQAFIERNF